MFGILCSFKITLKFEPIRYFIMLLIISELQYETHDLQIKTSDMLPVLQTKEKFLSPGVWCQPNLYNFFFIYSFFLPRIIV